MIKKVFSSQGESGGWKGHPFVSSKEACENRMMYNDIFLSPELEDTLYLLTVESRIKKLKQECEDLVEHSKHLQRDRQQLRERFEAGMKRNQALQMKVEQHMFYLRAKQEALWEYRNNLQQFLNERETKSYF
jgi:regulator of replication initiation timing